MQASITHPGFAALSARRRLPRRQRRKVTLTVLFVLLVGLGLFVAPHAARTMSRAEAPAIVSYTVVTGDTLWAVAAQYSQGKDVRQVIDTIEQTNHLKSAAVQPGQVLLIPVDRTH